MTENRRLKRLQVADAHVLDWFVGAIRGHPNVILLPALGVPFDTKVHGVNHDWASRCFEVLASHPSWPEVGLGMSIPSELLVPDWRPHVLSGNES